jgi:hypothetical protein
MPHADTLTVIHHDDTRTQFSDARYQLHRDGIRIWTADGEHTITDVLMTQANRQHADQSGQVQR